MDEPVDPEVLADIELRDRTRRERPNASAALYAWTPTPDVEHWPCRAGCGRMVGVPQEALDAAITFDRQLARTNEPPLNRAKIVFCSTCKASGMKFAAETNRRHVEALRLLIREAKESSTAADTLEERERIEKIRLMRHPNVVDFVAALREKREREGNSKNGKRRL